MKTRRLDLALQGGGTHGAFTWGVLDRLLEDERIRIGAISGSSAGAMNAVALAAGWTAGGRRGARETLHRFWSRVAESLHLADWAQHWLSGMPGMMAPASAPLQAVWDMAGAWFSVSDRNPLRAVLRDTVDFELVRRCTELQLFIGATNVRSGRLRIFRGAQIDIDAVLASSCLPMLFPAVVIDGEAYWDGGYGTDAMRVLCRFGFEIMNLHRIQLDVYGNNHRAIHVYEKVGFTREVTKRQALYKFGRYHDVHVMGLLEGELRME